MPDPSTAIDRQQPPDRPRLAFLDNLRAFVIVMVIVLHASITYMLYAPEWWYVLDRDRSLLFTMAVLVIDVALMPALFLVAGYFALPSLQRRGERRFLRDKAVRLAVPWLFGVLFLAPIATYLTYVSRDIPMGYLEFWATTFWGPLYQQSVYWFLGVLFALFVLLAWVYAASPRLRASAPRVELPRARLFVGFAAFTAVGSAVFAPFLGLDDWRNVPPFILQPARIVFYVGYFGLGVYAERRGWFGPGGFRPAVGPWGWAAVLAGGAYLAFRLIGPLDTAAGRAVAAVLFAAFCLAAVIAAIGLFQRWGNGTDPAWRTLAANSFGIYYVHPLILYPLAWLLLDVPIPALAKVAILVSVTLGGSLAVSALVLKRLPGVRRVF